VDLSWRLKIFDYKNFINNDTFIFHYGGGATGNFSRSKIANVIYGSFISIFTNYSSVALLFILPFYFIGLLLFYTLLTILKLDLRYASEMLKKFIYFLRNIKKTYSIRKFVQKKRVKSDFYVFRYISLLPAFFANKSISKIGKNYTITNT
jgi:GT2 family glycosyltransferase